MGKVATTELYTESDGWVEVDLYDPADFPDSPVEMYTDGVWGVPALTSTASADLPFEVYTNSAGWLGLSTTGYKVIADFETGRLDSWVESQDAGIEVTSGRAAFQGDYGLYLGTGRCERVVSAPTFSNPLPEYPSPGEMWDSFIRFDDPDSFSNDLWHKYGCQTYPTGNGFGTQEARHGYRVELDGANEYFRLYKSTGGFGDLLADTHVDLDLYQWYRLEIDWKYSTDGHIGRLYEVTKDDWVGTEVASYGPVVDNDYGTGAISCAAKAGVHWDLLRRTAPV